MAGYLRQVDIIIFDIERIVEPDTGSVYDEAEEQSSFRSDAWTDEPS